MKLPPHATHACLVLSWHECTATWTNVCNVTKITHCGYIPGYQYFEQEDLALQTSQDTCRTNTRAIMAFCWKLIWSCELEEFLLFPPNKFQRAAMLTGLPMLILSLKNPPLLYCRTPSLPTYSTKLIDRNLNNFLTFLTFNMWSISQVIKLSGST